MEAPEDFSLQPPGLDFPMSEKEERISSIITPISNTL